MKRLSVTNLSSENNLLMFQLNAPSGCPDDAWSSNIGKLFSELKLVTDNLLFCLDIEDCTFPLLCVNESFLG